MVSLYPTVKADPLYPTRPALDFAFYNALTWQVAFGAPMVLFAQYLGATPFQVGLAFSFMPLMTPLQVICTLFLPSLGFRKITLFGWGARIAFLFVPIWLAVLRPAPGRALYVDLLVASVFCFTSIRGCGMAALTGWIFAFVPAARRGHYYAIEQLWGAVGGVVILLLCATSFHFLSFYNAILVQYLIALAGNGLSVAAIARFPRVAVPADITIRRILRETPRHMFASGKFRSFLWLSAVWLVLTTPFPAFAAYYLKAVPHVSAGLIMNLEVLRYLAMGAGAWAVHRVIEPWGSRAIFQIAFATLATVLLYWAIYLPTGLGGYPALCASYILYGIACVCWVVASAEHLGRVMPAGSEALGVPLYGAITFALGGVAPIVLGFFLKAKDGFSVGGFEAYFAGELAATLALAGLILKALAGTEKKRPAVSVSARS